MEQLQGLSTDFLCSKTGPLPFRDPYKVSSVDLDELRTHILFYQHSLHFPRSHHSQLAKYGYSHVWARSGSSLDPDWLPPTRKKPLLCFCNSLPSTIYKPSKWKLDLRHCTKNPEISSKPNLWQSTFPLLLLIIWTTLTRLLNICK